MKLYSLFYSLIAVIVLASCTAAEIPPQPQADIYQAPQKVVVDKNFKAVMGQTIYVPVYSHIYYEDKKRIFNLAVTLSIRNTDLTNPVIVNSVLYHDSNGKLIRRYLEKPIQLAALASTDFFVARTDTSGGLGANFIVEWVAQTEVSEPVIEAVMIGADFQQGISFISPGKTIKTHNTYKQSSSVKDS